MATVRLEVEVDLDPIPGAYHTKEDAQMRIQRQLNNSISHYNPKVKIIEED